MNASRADWRRALDYSAVKDPDSITHAIQALLFRRADPMRQKEIERWFHGTPKAFISAALLTMLDRGQCKLVSTSLNRKRRVCAYYAGGYGKEE